MSEPKKSEPWAVLAGVLLLVDADTAESAGAKARGMLMEAHHRGQHQMFHSDHTTSQVIDAADLEGQPPLYPEYSRRMIEQCYHQSGAAMRYAARLLAGPGATDEQVSAKVGELLDGSQEDARKAEVIRRLRYTKGTAQ